MPFEFWAALPVMLAAPVQTLFLIIYAIPRFGAGQWWRSYVGRSIFLKSLSLAFLLNATLYYQIEFWIKGIFTGVDYHVDGSLEWVAVLGYWLLLYAVCYQAYALVRNRLFPEGHKHLG